MRLEQLEQLEQFELMSCGEATPEREARSIEGAMDMIRGKHLSFYRRVMDF